MSCLQLRHVLAADPPAPRQLRYRFNVLNIVIANARVRSACDSRDFARRRNRRLT
jgi:hypothetical protein